MKLLLLANQIAAFSLNCVPYLVTDRLAFISLNGD